MQIIVGLVFFFGLGLAALAILAVSARKARSASAVMFWAIVSVALMVLQCLLLGFLAGIGSATSGQQSGYRMLTGAILVFIISLAIYFWMAFLRLKDKTRK